MKKVLIAIMVMIVVAAGGLAGYLHFSGRTLTSLLKTQKTIDSEKKEVENELQNYMEHIEKNEFEEMYDMLDAKTITLVGKETFLERNQKIYTGIGANNIRIKVYDVIRNEKANCEYEIKYGTTMDTSAGEVKFDNSLVFLKEREEDNWGIQWDVSKIHPTLTDDYVVSVDTSSADTVPKRGKILDCNGKVLAKTVNGVRKYPQGRSACWVTGCMGKVNDDVIEKQGLDANIYGNDAGKLNVYGAKGLEAAFEKELRGTPGCGIYIKDRSGNIIETLAKKKPTAGKNIKTTIDMKCQRAIQNEISKERDSCVVCINPNSGAVLGIANSSTYDPNVEGCQTLNYAAQTMIPGSAMKPITALVGFASENVNQYIEFNDYSGKTWRGSGWTDAEEITTTSAGSTGSHHTLYNSLQYSDNIFFGRFALKIGGKAYQKGLEKLGFAKGSGYDKNGDSICVPFEMKGYKTSTYSTDSSKDYLTSAPAALAHSGYGQGQLLVNPLHMATIYSAFVNNGNMVKPHVKARKKTEYYAKNICDKEEINAIKKGLELVVSGGTGTSAQGAKVSVAGKTGTAQMTASKNDTNRNENGWFACYTYGNGVNEKNQVVIVTTIYNQVGCNADSEISHGAVKRTTNMINNIY